MSTEQQSPRYTMLIEWSDLDQAFIVTLPEWEQAGALAHTHGATYTEAARKGEELIAFLWRSAQSDGDRIPTPHTFDSHAYASDETAERLAGQNEALARQIEAQQTHAS